MLTTSILDRPLFNSVAITLSKNFKFMWINFAKFKSRRIFVVPRKIFVEIPCVLLVMGVTVA